MMKYGLIVFSAAILAVSSSPLGNHTEPLGDDCIVNSYDRVQNAVSKCTYIVINPITVPAGKALDMKLKDGTTLLFQGVTKFEHHEWKGPLVTISGNRVTVNGVNGALDGQGALYWDGKGGSGSTKPKFFRIKTKQGSRFLNMNLLNCPIQCVSVNSASDTVLDHFMIDVTAGDPNPGYRATNTDGFDISSSSGITIQNSVVKNQDDCVAVNQGHNFLFHNLTCSGSHGLSLSVGQSSASGSPNTVTGVTFSSCTVQNSDNGIHIKTHSDAGTGLISDVTYKDIQFIGIRKFGINVQQDYQNGQSTGYPTGNIPIRNLVLQNIYGSMAGEWDSRPVYILCGGGGCDSWYWNGINIGNGRQPNQCNFMPNGFYC